jgi:hypothetical protein
MHPDTEKGQKAFCLLSIAFCLWSVYDGLALLVHVLLNVVEAAGRFAGEAAAFPAAEGLAARPATIGFRRGLR